MSNQIVNLVKIIKGQLIAKLIAIDLKGRRYPLRLEKIERTELGAIYHCKSKLITKAIEIEFIEIWTKEYVSLHKWKQTYINGDQIDVVYHFSLTIG